MDAIGSVASIIQLIEVTGKVINYCAAVIGASKLIDDLGHTASTMLQFLYEVKRQVITDSANRSPLGLEDLIKELETCMVNLARQFEKLSPKGFLQKVRFVHMEKEIQKTIDKATRMNGFIGSWLSLDTNQKTKAIDDGVKALNSSVEEENLRGKMDRIVQHYAPVSFSEKHGNVLQQRQDGTGQWFLESPEFQDWMQSTGATLWCSGAPGAGKTVMASTAIEYLYEKVKGSDTSSLAYVYCDYRQRQDQKASILLGNIWAQLFRRRGPSATEIEHHFGEILARFDFTPTRTHMINLIREELTNGDWKRVYIVVDAIDECTDENEQNAFIDGLHSLQPLVNVLVTSRTLHSDNGGFDDVRSVRFTPTNEDMGIYISARIRESKKISSYVARKPELADQIRHTVIDRANGMFLLCRMHLDSLSRSITLKGLKDELNRIPKGENVVKDTYDQAMSRIRDQGANIEEFALRVIRWVCFARRPLKLAELLCALAVTPGDEELDEDAVGDESDITNYCAGLVVVEGDSKTVRFVHYTTQEYFNSLREGEEFVHSHGDIALTCITFLGLDDLTISEGGYVAQMWSAQEETPFLSYAALNFGYHCSREAEVLGSEESDVSNEITELLLEFLQRPEHVKRAALTILLRVGGRVSPFMEEPEFCNALFTKAVAMDIAAFFGVIRNDDSDDQNTEQAGDPKEKWFGNSLHWACLNDSLDPNLAITHPVDHGIDIYTHSIRWAHAAKGLLVELSTTDFSAQWPPGRKEQTALHLATAVSGPQRILDALLDSPHANAIRRNHIQSVDTILAKNRQHKYADFYPAQVLSGLYLAARTCGPTMINLLPGEGGVLHHAANLQLFNIPDSKGNLPLHFAAKSGNMDAVVALLKQDGIQVDSRNQEGHTALLLAAEDNLVDICSRLLKAGANINTKDNSGLTPFALAIRKRFSELIVPGELNDDDIAWLQQQPWGHRILRRSSTTPNLSVDVEYWPKQEEDIVHSSPLLRTSHQGHSSAFLASYILDLAEYWIRSSIRRWGDPVIPYLTSRTITKFEITGHDQGYCSNPERGESWTWFTADVHRRESSDQGTTNHEIYLAHNRGANRTWHTHKLVWSLADPEVAEAERGTWIKGLMPGDRIVILPHARYPGWENWVRRMRIDIYTTFSASTSTESLPRYELIAS
ncbi:ankyrin [Rostrohypoxylon terebratum]|nr:ankyrin [Rostrohypoxylon terebratum]